MRRFRLTAGAKVLIFVLVFAIAGVGVFFGLKNGHIKNDLKPEYDDNGNVMNINKSDNQTINLSLDEWIGWKPIIDANGGLSTQPGSIYDDLGIKVNISIINDGTQSSNALISKKLDAAGYTINRVAFLSDKFKKANLNVIMPYITNFSNGGDGIIAKSNINTVKDLTNAKIGVPQFSEAHSLVVWFVNQSDLSNDEKQNIIKNLIFFETPDEAAKAFFAGEIDVAATWQPYLTQAKNMSDAHILFSTASSSSLVMDGILFNKEFAEANRDIVSKFIDGALKAADKYSTDTKTIKKVMPMFATATEEDVKENCESAKLTTYGDNIQIFNGTAKTIYNDMCNVWVSIGESVNKNLVDTMYDDTYIKKLSEKYDENLHTTLENRPAVNDDNKEDLVNAEALLKKSTTVNFIINTSKFSNTSEATTALNEFIEIAKVLDGTIIEIAGNTDPNPNTDPDDTLNKRLSLSRADAVKQYFIMSGIEADRIVTVGNGSSKPVVNNDTEEHKAMNRRTDVSFKCIE